MDLFSWLRRENEPRSGRADDAPGVSPTARPLPEAARGEATPDTPDTPDTPVAPDVPTPVTADRIRAWCEARGYTYFTDSEGDVGGIWRGRLFFFFLLGDDDDILQVRGHWNREFTIERLPEVLELCNAWHVTKIWPSSYARVRDNGRVNVTTEVTTDVSCGATDAQLELILQCGLGTGTVFLDHLDEAYPDPAVSLP